MGGPALTLGDSRTLDPGSKFSSLRSSGSFRASSATASGSTGRARLEVPLRVLEGARGVLRRQLCQKVVRSLPLGPILVDAVSHARLMLSHSRPPRQINERNILDIMFNSTAVGIQIEMYRLSFHRWAKRVCMRSSMIMFFF